MKKILFAASEAVPFIKTGGLADVVGSLPKYFDRGQYDVRVILPKYACMEERFKNTLQFVTHFYVDLGWRKQYAGILTAKEEGIQYYFVDNEFYFAGEHPYGEFYAGCDPLSRLADRTDPCLPKTCIQYGSGLYKDTDSIFYS